MFTRQRYVAGDLTGQSRVGRRERFYLFGHLALFLSLSRPPFLSCFRPLLAKTTPCCSASIAAFSRRFAAALLFLLPSFHVPHTVSTRADQIDEARRRRSRDSRASPPPRLSTHSTHARRMTRAESISVTHVARSFVHTRRCLRATQRARDGYREPSLGSARRGDEFDRRACSGVEINVRVRGTMVPSMRDVRVIKAREIRSRSVRKGPRKGPPKFRKESLKVSFTIRGIVEGCVLTDASAVGNVIINNFSASYRGPLSNGSSSLSRTLVKTVTL